MTRTRMDAATFNRGIQMTVNTEVRICTMDILHRVNPAFRFVWELGYTCSK